VSQIGIFSLELSYLIGKNLRGDDHPPNSQRLGELVSTVELIHPPDLGYLIQALLTERPRYSIDITMQSAWSVLNGEIELDQGFHPTS